MVGLKRNRSLGANRYCASSVSVNGLDSVNQRLFDLSDGAVFGVKWYGRGGLCEAVSSVRAAFRMKRVEGDY